MSSSKIVTPKADKKQVVCGYCNRVTAHDVLTGARFQDSSPDGDIHVWSDYWVVRCRGCESHSFLLESGNSEDFDPFDNSPLLTTALFPPRQAGRAKLEKDYYLPEMIRRVYDETYRALIQNLPILAGIGIRGIVEAVCNDRSIAGRNLEKRIDGLLNARLITPVEAKILHSLRFMGNTAAHEATAHSSEELGTAFEVCEHLLKTVYLLERSARHLPKKKKSSASTADEEEF